MFGLSFNPLQREIGIHILHTDPCTSPIVRYREFVQLVRASLFGDHFPYSHKLILDSTVKL